ncbi:hypothetical protein [Streptomyces swartbergensis]|uniref:hypothetical protein n=1 Tax=Streptomyces swartbergensis TaxID=487165 RepID=UPI001302145F
MAVRRRLPDHGDPVDGGQGEHVGHGDDAGEAVGAGIDHGPPALPVGVFLGGQCCRVGGLVGAVSALFQDSALRRPRPFGEACPRHLGHVGVGQGEGNGRAPVCVGADQVGAGDGARREAETAHQMVDQVVGVAQVRDPGVQPDDGVDAGHIVRCGHAGRTHMGLE